MGWSTSWDKPIIPVADVAMQNNMPIVEFKNKIPTHDPYTNPGAFLYYECECGQVLDPRVKSFASLNNHASNSGWKVRWGPHHYVPYCPKCVAEKGIE